MLQPALAARLLPEMGSAASGLNHNPVTRSCWRKAEPWWRRRAQLSVRATFSARRAPRAPWCGRQRAGRPRLCWRCFWAHGAGVVPAAHPEHQGWREYGRLGSAVGLRVHLPCLSRPPRHQVALGASGGSGRRPVGGAGAGGILFIESGVDITRPETLTPELFKGVTQVGGPRLGPRATCPACLMQQPRAGGAGVCAVPSALSPALRGAPGCGHQA